MRKYAALIPIKDHSERVPGKNFRVIAGRPLWDTSSTRSLIDAIGDIFIDTDSQRFIPELLEAFPKVRILERPRELHGDFVPTNAIFAHDLSVINRGYTHFVQTHTTNPLLKPDTVLSILRAFEDAEEDGSADSMFTVTPYHARFYRRDGSPLNHDPKVLLRTQDLEPLLEENSNLYVFTRASFSKTGARIGARPAMFEMDRLEATDIDDPETWTLAEALLNGRPNIA